MIVQHMVIVICLWFFAFPVSAQMYQYRDENNNLCFTDDLTRVPQAKQDTLEELFSVNNLTPQDVILESDPLSDQAINPEKVLNNAEEKNAQELNRLKEEMDNNYKLLQEKRASLQAGNPSENASLEEFNEFRNKVMEFNAEVQSYQKKQEEFDKWVKAFNEQVKQSNDGQSMLEDKL
jgi:hypothetical protein